MPALFLALALSSASQARASPLMSAALYSSAAYCPAGKIHPGGVTAACSTLSLSGVRVFQGNVQQCPEVRGGQPPHAFVTTDESLKSIVVSFEGTDAASADDVLLDLTALPTRCRTVESAPPLPGIVHEGFCCYYKSIVRAGLVEEVRKRLAQHAGYQLLITGHSLGGAAAQLAGVDLALLLKPSRLEVYTFGAPRTGDAEFNAALAAHTGGANVVDAEDVIPRVPPGWPATIRHDVVPVEWSCRAPFGLPLPPSLNMCDRLLAHLYYLGIDVVSTCCPQPGPAASAAARCMEPPSQCQRVGADAALEAAPAGSAVNSIAPGPLASPGSINGSASATKVPNFVFP